jgi:3D (Asp-Asp-Asp) domain-containing protein
MKRIGYLVILLMVLVVCLCAYFLFFFQSKKSIVVNNEVTTAKDSMPIETSTTNSFIELIDAMNDKITSLSLTITDLKKSDASQNYLTKKETLANGQTSIDITGLGTIVEVNVEGLVLNPTEHYTINGNRIDLHFEGDEGDYAIIKYSL